MRVISVSDITMKRFARSAGNPFPFRVKLEIAKLLDRLGVSVIEVDPITDGRKDSLLIKSLAAAVSDSTIAVPVDISDPSSVAMTWEALRGARSPRLQVAVPVSTVRMEYSCHRKPEAMIKLISEFVSSCAALCPEVEFIAQDFGRSDPDFALSVIDAAISAGASVVTIGNSAGNLLPEEFHKAVKTVREHIPDTVRLGAYCSNALALADACAIDAVRAGADEVKTSPYEQSTVSLANFVMILEARGELCGACSSVNSTELKHICDQIRRLCDDCQRMSPASVSGVRDELSEIRLTINDDMSTVLQAASRLGYELGDDDSRAVYETFVRLAANNGSVEGKELDAIVASVAFQVPATYILESYVINTGNVITATCHIRLRKGDSVLESVCVGDGPVDASFLAIEKVVGRHYELDDFQIRSVTEGREAMGEAVVRLLHNGKIFSGRGISTDIVGSSIMAYLNALNKIAYEEVEA